MDEVLAPLRTRFDVVLRETFVGDRTWRLARPRSADELIDEAAFQRDGRIPYWADVWLSAYVLAVELAKRRPPGARLIELGCGVGFSAVVAAGLGYRVLATDYYAEALEFVSANARLNGLDGLATALVDWRSPPDGMGRFDVVAAADVLYERPNVPLVAALFDRYLADDGIGFCTDPQRGSARSFPEECRRAGLSTTAFIRTAEENGRRREIDLYVVRRPSAADDD